ncbi:MAG: hypothetical protein MUC49_05765 [Raineya sp.]|jgi:hypothetical protein|nr:hypothetical protein [Raineya sp.]
MFLRFFYIVLIFFICSGLSHPIKLTASLLEYKQTTGELSYECKVFIDDFESSINKSLSKKINTQKPTQEDIAGINRHFGKHVKIWINGKEISLTYKSSEIVKSANVCIIRFKEVPVRLKKGDKIQISNSLFFEEFEYAQTNLILVKIPPFVKEENYDLSLDNRTVNFSL